MALVFGIPCCRALIHVYDQVTHSPLHIEGQAASLAFVQVTLNGQTKGL